MNNNPRHADRKKEKLYHHHDLNRNKQFIDESNGHETIHHPETEKHVQLQRFYVSSSLDYFARLSNPKTGPFRYHEPVPTRIHGRQLPASSELDSLSQLLVTASPKPESHSLATTEQLVDPHTRDI